MTLRGAGVVAEENPYDKLQLTATIPSSDPLFQQKRALLQPAGLATQQTFDLQAGKVRPGARPSVEDVTQGSALVAAALTLAPIGFGVWNSSF